MLLSTGHENKMHADYDALFPSIDNKKERQMLTYREADVSLLFKVESVRLKLDDFECLEDPAGV
jgi:hypothetical protein